MNQAKFLRQKLGRQYAYRQYYSGRQLADLPKSVSGVLAASLTAGCLRLDAVVYPKDGQMALGYEFLVRQRETIDWICFDSPDDAVILKESAMASVLERVRKKYHLTYTDCRFPELPGKRKGEH
ncbi:MAG TPA: hypothetical protein IAC17_07280 [Candidatus Faecousia faecipullorum]|nr:hypothetical protein [Candidatus Faecousia faecipullorum]